MLLRRTFAIWRSRRPRPCSSPSPSPRDGPNAASRSGPSDALGVRAGEDVAASRTSGRTASLPFERSSASSRRSPTDGERAQAAAATSRECRLSERSRGGKTIHWAAGRSLRNRLRQLVQAPLGRRDHALGHALPAVAAARHVGQRGGGPRLAPPARASASARACRRSPRPRRGRASKESSGRSALVERGREGGGDLGHPRVGRGQRERRRRRRPRRRPSRTPPGRCSAPPGPRRPAAGPGRSSCSSRPVKWTRARGLGRRLRVGARAARRRARRGTPPGGASSPGLATALELAPAGGRARATPSEVGGAEQRRQALEALAVGAEAHHHQPRLGHRGDHERPGREQQVDPLRHDQLAHVARRCGRGAGRARAALRRRRPRRPRPPPRPPSSRPREARPGRPPPPPRGRGPEGVHVHAGRAQPRAVGQAGLARDLPQALRGVARAHQHARRPGEALERVGEEALAVGPHGVLERAAVDLHGVRHPPLQARASTAGPITRWLASATSGPTRARDHLAHRRDVGLEVALQLSSSSSGNGHRPRSPRSGRPRRRAAAARCPEVVHVRRAAPARSELGSACAVLAEQVDLVPEPRERPRQRLAL